MSQALKVVAGMAAEYLVPESRRVDVQVNLGRGDGLVAEHHLYGAQIGAAFEQMRGERMAQRVRADIFNNVAACAQVFDDVKHHHARHFSAHTVQEERIAVVVLYAFIATAFHPRFDGIDGTCRDWHHTLLLPFSLDDDIFFFDV